MRRKITEISNHSPKVATANDYSLVIAAPDIIARASVLRVVEYDSLDYEKSRVFIRVVL